jgi:hypothetical protein
MSGMRERYFAFVSIWLWLILGVEDDPSGNQATTSEVSTKKSVVLSTPEIDLDDPTHTIPLQRYNAMLAVLRNTLYMYVYHSWFPPNCCSVLLPHSYGGIYERGSREYTLDDFYLLQLDKLDRYVCLKESGVVIGDNEESSSDDDDDGSEDDELSDDEDEDVLETVESAQSPIEATEERADGSEKDDQDKATETQVRRSTVVQRLDVGSNSPTCVARYSTTACHLYGCIKG